MRRTRAAVGVLAAALAGCAGGTSPGPNPCAAPAGTTTVLVYPAPGSSGLPDAIDHVVLGSTSALPAGYQAFLIDDSTGEPLRFGYLAAAPTPLPAPNALPAFPNPVYQSSTNPGAVFGSGDTIDVHLENANGNCSPTHSLGMFRVR